MSRMTRAGSRVILSGLLVVQAETIIESYVAAGFRLQNRNDLGEWSALIMERV